MKRKEHNIGPNSSHKATWLWFGLTLASIFGLTLLGPPERSLGANVRVVYLHGVWVWAALAAYLTAGLIGAAGLFSNRVRLQLWSRALGRTGLFFWITYLPISIWAMQTNWNGLFLAEPRWRLALIFAVSGLLLQIGLTLIENPAWSAGANFIFLIAMFWALQGTEDVMHPSSPIFGSEAWRIQIFFIALLTVTLLAAAQMAGFFYRLERKSLSLRDS